MPPSTPSSQARIYSCMENGGYSHYTSLQFSLPHTVPFSSMEFHPPTADSSPLNSSTWVLPMGCSPSWIALASVSSFRHSLLLCGIHGGVTLLQHRHPPAPMWSSPWAGGGSLLPCVPPWATGAQLPHYAPRAAGEPQIQCLLTDLGVCRVVYLTYSNSSFLAVVV